MQVKTNTWKSYSSYLMCFQCVQVLTFPLDYSFACIFTVYFHNLCTYTVGRKPPTAILITDLSICAVFLEMSESKAHRHIQNKNQWMIADESTATAAVIMG